MDDVLGGPSTGLVVALLNAASAAFKGSVGRRLPGDLDILPSIMGISFEAISYKYAHVIRKWKRFLDAIGL